MVSEMPPEAVRKINNEGNESKEILNLTLGYEE